MLIFLFLTFSLELIMCVGLKLKGCWIYKEKLLKKVWYSAERKSALKANVLGRMQHELAISRWIPCGRWILDQQSEFAFGCVRLRLAISSKMTSLSAWSIPQPLEANVWVSYSNIPYWTYDLPHPGKTVSELRETFGGLRRLLGSKFCYVKGVKYGLFRAWYKEKKLFHKLVPDEWHKLFTFLLGQFKKVLETMITGLFITRCLFCSSQVLSQSLNLKETREHSACGWTQINTNRTWPRLYMDQRWILRHLR